MIVDIAKVILPAIISFIVGIAITPALTYFLYSHKMWKKKAGKIGYDGKEAVIFNKLHKEKEVGTPRMGGIIIWLSAFIVIIAIWILARIIPIDFTTKLDFLSRSQTWLPLSTLLIGAFVGLIDDYYEVRGNSEKDQSRGGLSLRVRLLIVALVGLSCGVWFYFKLDVSTIGVIGGGTIFIGPLIVPLFALVCMALYSGGVIDGIDGLAGGIFAIMYLAYAGIAFHLHQVNLAAFCALIAGSTLAFLWFNIPPARYYMSETGSMALTITLGVVAFMTDSLGHGQGVFLLPIVALPLVITTLSVIIQLLSKKLRGKKVFIAAPLHHHFEAIGWPSYKVTMRFWIVGIISALIGLILALISSI